MIDMRQVDITAVTDINIDVEDVRSHPSRV